MSASSRRKRKCNNKKSRICNVDPNCNDGKDNGEGNDYMAGESPVDYILDDDMDAQIGSQDTLKFKGKVANVTAERKMQLNEKFECLLGSEHSIKTLHPNVVVEAFDSSRKSKKSKCYGAPSSSGVTRIKRNADNALTDLLTPYFTASREKRQIQAPVRYDELLIWSGKTHTCPRSSSQTKVAVCYSNRAKSMPAKTRKAALNASEHHRQDSSKRHEQDLELVAVIAAESKTNDVNTVEHNRKQGKQKRARKSSDRIPCHGKYASMKSSKRASVPLRGNNNRRKKVREAGSPNVKADFQASPSCSLQPDELQNDLSPEENHNVDSVPSRPLGIVDTPVQAVDVDYCINAMTSIANSSGENGYFKRLSHVCVAKFPCCFGNGNNDGNKNVKSHEKARKEISESVTFPNDAAFAIPCSDNAIFTVSASAACAKNTVSQQQAVAKAENQLANDEATTHQQLSKHQGNKTECERHTSQPSGTNDTRVVQPPKELRQLPSQPAITSNYIISQKTLPHEFERCRQRFLCTDKSCPTHIDNIDSNARCSSPNGERSLERCAGNFLAQGAELINEESNPAVAFMPEAKCADLTQRRQLRSTKSQRTFPALYAQFTDSNQIGVVCSVDSQVQGISAEPSNSNDSSAVITDFDESRQLTLINSDRRPPCAPNILHCQDDIDTAHQLRTPLAKTGLKTSIPTGIPISGASTDIALRCDNISSVPATGPKREMKRRSNSRLNSSSSIQIRPRKKKRDSDSSISQMPNEVFESEQVQTEFSTHQPAKITKTLETDENYSSTVPSSISPRLTKDPIDKECKDEGIVECPKSTVVCDKRRHQKSSYRTRISLSRSSSNLQVITGTVTSSRDVHLSPENLRKSKRRTGTNRLKDHIQMKSIQIPTVMCPSDIGAPPLVARRPRGRPRKHPLAVLNSQGNESLAVSDKRILSLGNSYIEITSEALDNGARGIRKSTKRATRPNPRKLEAPDISDQFSKEIASKGNTVPCDVKSSNVKLSTISDSAVKRVSARKRRAIPRQSRALASAPPSEVISLPPKAASGSKRRGKKVRRRKAGRLPRGAASPLPGQQGVVITSRHVHLPRVDGLSLEGAESSVEGIHERLTDLSVDFADTLQYQESLHTADSRLPKIKIHLRGHKITLPQIVIGGVQIKAWCRSSYPAEFASLQKFYICEFCLNYMKSFRILKRHSQKCEMFGPPGRIIFQREGHSVFEVNGANDTPYCQNLCLLSKMFLDHKTLHTDVEPFLFYVLTRDSPKGHHIVGYFSKEKMSARKYNLSCIMVLPNNQRHGYGKFLIDFSYILSLRKNEVGTPEVPLSDLGQMSYLSYWKRTITRFLDKIKATGKRSFKIKEISKNSGIMTSDVASALKALRMLKFKKERITVLSKAPNRKGRRPQREVFKPALTLLSDLKELEGHDGLRDDADYVASDNEADTCDKSIPDAPDLSRELGPRETSPVNRYAKAPKPHGFDKKRKEIDVPQSVKKYGSRGASTRVRYCIKSIRKKYARFCLRTQLKRSSSLNSVLSFLDDSDVSNDDDEGNLDSTTCPVEEMDSRQSHVQVNEMPMNERSSIEVFTFPGAGHHDSPRGKDGKPISFDEWASSLDGIHYEPTYTQLLYMPSQQTSFNNTTLSTSTMSSMSASPVFVNSPDGRPLSSGVLKSNHSKRKVTPDLTFSPDHHSFKSQQNEAASEVAGEITTNISDNDHLKKSAKPSTDYDPPCSQPGRESRISMLSNRFLPSQNQVSSLGSDNHIFDDCVAASTLLRSPPSYPPHVSCVTSLSSIANTPLHPLESSQPLGDGDNTLRFISPTEARNDTVSGSLHPEDNRAIDRCGDVSRQMSYFGNDTMWSSSRRRCLSDVAVRFHDTELYTELTANPNVHHSLSPSQHCTQLCATGGNGMSNLAQPVIHSLPPSISCLNEERGQDGLVLESERSSTDLSMLTNQRAQAFAEIATQDGISVVETSPGTTDINGINLNSPTFFTRQVTNCVNPSPNTIWISHQNPHAQICSSDQRMQSGGSIRRTNLSRPVNRAEYVCSSAEPNHSHAQLRDPTNSTSEGALVQQMEFRSYTSSTDSGIHVPEHEDRYASMCRASAPPATVFPHYYSGCGSLLLPSTITVQEEEKNDLSDNIAAQSASPVCYWNTAPSVSQDFLACPPLPSSFDNYPIEGTVMQPSCPSTSFLRVSSLSPRYFRIRPRSAYQGMPFHYAPTATGNAPSTNVNSYVLPYPNIGIEHAQVSAACSSRFVRPHLNIIQHSGTNDSQFCESDQVFQLPSIQRPFRRTQTDYEPVRFETPPLESVVDAEGGRYSVPLGFFESRQGSYYLTENETQQTTSTADNSLCVQMVDSTLRSQSIHPLEIQPPFSNSAFRNSSGSIMMPPSYYAPNSQQAIGYANAPSSNIQEMRCDDMANFTACSLLPASHHSHVYHNEHFQIPHSTRILQVGDSSRTFRHVARCEPGTSSIRAPALNPLGFGQPRPMHAATTRTDLPVTVPHPTSPRNDSLQRI